MYQLSHRLILLIFSLCCMSGAYATPFTIVPSTPMPTVVAPGGLTSVTYTVSNNTSAQRNNISVAYLPPYVSVNNSVGCTTTFSLAPKGQPGSSCSLVLNINGPVNANDPDPYHHLFVCLPGNKTCVGTSYPLNITVSNKFMAYVANHYSVDTISICPVQASGRFGTCTPFTDPTFNYPIDVILNPAASVAYVANSADSILSWCTVNPNGSLNPCQSVPAEGLNSTGMWLNNAGDLLYYTNIFSNSVYACSINAQGIPSNCRQISSTVSAPDGRISINSDGTIAYVPENGAPGVGICPINANGTLGACTTATDPALPGPVATIIDPMKSNLYVANYSNNNSTLAICPLNANDSLQTCTTTTGNGTFHFEGGSYAANMFFLAINGITYLYVPNGGTSSPGNVSMCPLQVGSLGTCITLSDPSFVSPTGVWIATLA